MGPADMRSMRAYASMRTKRFLASLWHDTHGTAAVEFGLLVPLLMLMLLGTIEVSRAVSVDRHFTTAVQNAGDLVAREEYMGTSQAAAKQNLKGVMAAVQQMMQPFDVKTLKVDVYSVVSSPKNAADTRVVWKYSYDFAQSGANNTGTAVTGACSAYALPDNLLDKNMTVIVVDAQYTYSSLTDYLPAFSTMTFSDKSYHSPRNMCVDFVEGDQCKTC
jgi:Flp pilus assembly protein TadG